MARIFISYSHTDRRFVESLVPSLRRLYGHNNVWYDDELLGGEDWWQMILSRIAECDLFIYLMSDKSQESRFCQAELREALRLRKHFLPVIVRQGTNYPGKIPPDLRPMLQGKQFVDLSGGLEDTDAVTRLYASVSRLLEGASPQHQVPPTPLDPRPTPLPLAQEEPAIRPKFKLNKSRTLITATAIAGVSVIVAVLILVSSDNNGRAINTPALRLGAAAIGDFEIGGTVFDFGEITQSHMREAGMTWAHSIVMDIGEDHDDLINKAHDAGFKILFTVIGDKDQVMDTSYQDSYASYTAQLASAGADAVEVWREMNSDRYWPSGLISGANYVPLLTKTYKAIKTANPNTLVISGAPSPTGLGDVSSTDWLWNDDVYLKSMAESGAARYADCIGLHYLGGISPFETAGHPLGDYPTFYYLLQIQRTSEHFPEGMRLCFTGIGYPSSEGLPKRLPAAFEWMNDATVVEQAEWLAEAATLALQNHVRLMIVWNLDSPCLDSACDQVNAAYAIKRPDGTCLACNMLGYVMAR